MFHKGSRYADAETYETVDPQERAIIVVAPPETAPSARLGVHLRRHGQRIDHLAAKYLGDPTAFWRLCEHNNVMLPDALSEVDEIEIPRRMR